MYYITLDLEWNQSGLRKNDIARLSSLNEEIIEIGAIKLDEQLKIVDHFRAFVKPCVNKKINKNVARIININHDDIAGGVSFYDAIAAFQEWCGVSYQLFTWGNDDIRILKRNLLYFNQDDNFLKQCYNLQKLFAFYHLGDMSNQKSLSFAVEFFNIPLEEAFHSAIADARYTALVLQHMDTQKALINYKSHIYNSVRLDITIGESQVTYTNFQSLHHAVTNPKVSGIKCPVCSQVCDMALDWFSYSSNKQVAFAVCFEHGGL
ncbi:MAG: 3'-5' exonuclease, partial [Oscillospiraceae bacterium]